MGRVYAVASGKGGVGKTTTVANLGAVLAEGGHETVVVDADLGMGNLAGALGIDADAGPTVHDVLAERATADEALREGPAGLSVLPASNDLDDFGMADPAKLPALLDGLDADIVLVDASAGLSHDSVEPLHAADEVLLVSTPERGAVRDTVKTREVTERFGTPLAGAVVTRVTAETNLDGLSHRLGVPIRGSVPEDSSVAVAAEAGKPLVVSAPNAPATAAYRRLAAELTGDESLEPANEPTDGASEHIESAEAVTEVEDGAAELDEERAGDEGEANEERDESEAGVEEGETTDAAGDESEEDTDETESEGTAEEEDADETESEDSAAGGEAEDEDGSADEDSGRTGFLRWLLR